VANIRIGTKKAARPETDLSPSSPGLGKFAYVVAARALASFIAALGITLSVLLVFAAAYGQALIGLLVFLFAAFWALNLIKDFERGMVLLPFGYVHRSLQAVSFWVFFCLSCVLIPVLVVGTAWALLGP